MALFLLLLSGCDDGDTGRVYSASDVVFHVEIEDVDCPEGETMNIEPPVGGYALRLDYCAVGDTVSCADQRIETDGGEALRFGCLSDQPEGSYYRIVWLVPQ